MQRNTKLLGAAAFGLALAGGGIAGAALGTPTTTLADPGAVVASGPDHGTEPGWRGPGDRLETVAEAIGISVEDLRAALADGSSIADIATANGVDPDDVVEALVAEATARLEEIEAALPERMTDLVEREGWGDRGGWGEGPRRHRGTADGDLRERLGGRPDRDDA